MASTFTANLGLAKPAFDDAGWDATINGDLDAIDALAPLANLAVVPHEVPSTTLGVRVLPGVYRQAGGAIASYAGVNPQAIAATSTKYLYLTDAGTLTVDTGWPSTPHVRLAVVTTDASKVTTIVDARVPAASIGSGPVVGVVAVSAAYSIQPADGHVRGSTAGGAFAVTLPSAVANPGMAVRVWKADASANALTVNTTSSQAINGGTSTTLTTQYTTKAFVSNGAGWDQF